MLESVVGAFSQLTLTECQDRARANSPVIRQLALIEKSKEVNLSNASKLWLPQFGISAMAVAADGMPEIPLPGATVETEHFQLAVMTSLLQTVWDGGISSAKVEMTRAETEVEKAKVEVSLYAIRSKVNELYFGILSINEQIKQVDILTENLVRNRNRAEISLQNGVIHQSDLDKIQVEIYKAELSKINLTTYKTAYLKMLAVIIGREIGENEMLEIPKPVNLSELGSIGNRPELTMFARRREAIDAQHSLLSTKITPKIQLQGMVTTLTPGIRLANIRNNHFLFGALVVQWNIGGFYTRKNELNLLKIKKNIIDTQQNAFMQSIDGELAQKRSQLERHRLLVEKDNEIVKLRERVKSASEKKFENGTITMSELIDDINAENLARQTRNRHQIEFLMYQYDIKNTLGEK